MYMFTSTVMNNDMRIKNADCSWLQEVRWTDELMD